MFRVTWCPPDRLPGKVAKICTKDGHKQTNKTSTKIQTKRTKKHRTTEEEMEGPTSSGGSRNRLTCLTLQEHDDDDEIASDIKLVFHSSTIAMMHGPINIRFKISSLMFLFSPSFIARTEVLAGL